MAVQIVIWALLESGHQISAMAVSLNISRRPTRLLVTRLHLFENGATSALCPIDASRRLLLLSRSALMPRRGPTVTCCSEI